MTNTITLETHNDGLNVRTRTLTLAEAVNELQALLDAGRFGTCFALADELLRHGRDHADAFAGLRVIARVPAKDGMRDSLIDRIDGVNRTIRFANRRRAS